MHLTNNLLEGKELSTAQGTHITKYLEYNNSLIPRR
jgi:hypothetical protein